MNTWHGDWVLNKEQIKSTGCCTEKKRFRLCNMSNFRSLSHWSLKNVPRPHSWKEKCFYCLVSYFSHSLIEQNILKWKPNIPREQRGSILDCRQAMIWITLKELLMPQAVKWLQLNVPHPTSPAVDCQIYRWVMISSSWKTGYFLAFIARTYKRKDSNCVNSMSCLH